MMTVLQMHLVLVFFVGFLSIINCSESFVELTDSNFDTEIIKYPLSLVKFYAPWCGHCKNLAPIFAQAADDLKGVSQLIKVNCDEHKTTCGKFEIKGYPTLKVFKSGELFEDYKGARDLVSIVKAMKYHASPPSKLFATESELQQHLKNVRKYTVVGRFTSLFVNDFMALATKLRESYEFLHLQLESGGTSMIELHQPFYLRTTLENHFVSANFESIEKNMEFISSKRSGMVGECDTNFHSSFSLPLITVKLPFDIDNSLSSWKQYRNRLFKIAQAHSELKFCIIKNGEYAKLFSSLTEEPEQVSLVIENVNGHKFAENFEPTTATEFAQKVSTFIDSYNNGQIEATDSVVTLTSQNFDEIVYNSKKHVMIKFYAPWCGHCKKLAPIFEKLSSKYRNNELLTIAKFDATVHEPPAKFKVEGFPTLYFVNRGDVANPITYSGDRSLEDLSKFIDEHLDRSDEL